MQTQNPPLFSTFPSARKRSPFLPIFPLSPAPPFFDGEKTGNGDSMEFRYKSSLLQLVRGKVPVSMLPRCIF